MAVRTAMFIFEVVVAKVQSFVESRNLVIKADFSDIFSLELRDPKQMYIVIPDPPPLPPEPPGKKGKKKPKPKKPKKGAKPPEPPPEPDIQSGQSVLFTSSAEWLTQKMKKFPLDVSLWSKEDHLKFIGSSTIPWDPVFLQYLQVLYNCSDHPPVTVRDDYNVFEEGKGNVMAKITLQVKLSYMTDRIVTAFRTLTEDPSVRKWLYTGMNSKTTSYMCTIKTTDEEYQENDKKLQEQSKDRANKYTKERNFPSPGAENINYASYKNAPAAKVPLYDEGEAYCCKGFADHPPTEKYAAAETCPDIDFICDYIRKIITSCNDNMRMLTPRPTIRPRVRATDIDRLCYCKETNWPQGDLAERFRRETQGGPCPVCIRDVDGKPRKDTEGAPRRTLDISTIRGPCGRHDCKIAREMRVYLENLADEDAKEINFDDLIGPCGSKTCTIVDRIKDFLRHKGPFSHGGVTKEGLSTQCACMGTMQEALTAKKSCDSICSKDCENDSDEYCGGKICPYQKADPYHPSEDESSGKKGPTSGPGSESEKRGGEQKVYQVYYFTVDHTGTSSGNTSKTTGTRESPTTDSKSSNRCPNDPTQYCAPSCPVKEMVECSKDICPSQSWPSISHPSCVNPKCPRREKEERDRPSPADSDIVIPFSDIRNPCCVKSCDVAEKVKDYIVEGLAKRDRPKPCIQEMEDPCFCDCVCTFKFSPRTTYCPICGGYECLGDDMNDLPAVLRPHPCPVYHKLYDKDYIKTVSPWPDENKKEEAPAPKVGAKRSVAAAISLEKSQTTIAKQNFQDGAKKAKKKKASSKTEAAVSEPHPEHKKKKNPWQIDPVPRWMGWNWKSEDIPGMKTRRDWRPGAANKVLVRRYKAVREGIDIIAKKKRAMLNKKKKLEMKPTLVVNKVEGGEYVVQMEVFRKYSKERMIHQYPYEEAKPPLVYTIGKTEETKAKLQRQRESRERRQNRRKSRLLQSTFRDKCQEICLKAYNQSIGLLPGPSPNNPECPCDTPAVKFPEEPLIDSCSCSDSGTISSSDTDDDEWTVEFTPPIANWNPKVKHPPTYQSSECQYNYLDFRVKLVDKQGNPVPRFFRGPDGKQECSDLGGFWGPNHVWLEINKDGFIACDNRWVPMSFIGLDGQMYNSDEGTFTDTTGREWRIGIDGYVDVNGKWVPHGKGVRVDKGKSNKSFSTVGAPLDPSKRAGTQAAGDAKKVGAPAAAGKPAGAAAPKILKTANVPTATSTGKDTQTKKGKTVSVMNVRTSQFGRWGAMRKYGGLVTKRSRAERSEQEGEQTRLLDAQAARYQEIMQNLQMYDDAPEPRPPVKTSRACNTPRAVFPTSASFDSRYGASSQDGYNVNVKNTYFRRPNY